MKAAVYTRYGPPGVVTIQDVEKPSPKDNEVLVRIRATTVCAADWRLRSANPFLVRFLNGLRRPKKINILGMEFSGTVDSIGKNVTRFAPGDHVFGGAGFKFGAHAQYISVPEDGRLAIKPANMPLDDSAAILFGGLSALHFLRKGGIAAGQKVLINGASGSVGVFALQLAKYFGAHVTAVCSTANLDLVRSLGADEVVDYTRDDFAKAGGVYDLVFDAAGKIDFDRGLKSLKRGGVYLLIGGSGNIWSMLAGMLRMKWLTRTGRAKFVTGMAAGTSADQAFLRGLIEEGKLRTVVDKRYSLAQIAEAHKYAEAGHKKGHVVVVVEEKA